MQTFTTNRTIRRNNREALSRPVSSRYGKSLWVLLVAATIILSACSGTSHTPTPTPLTGNWQFTVANPADGSFLGGVQGGFLVQTGGSVTGAAVYAVALPTNQGTPCNSGSAAITGTVSGQNVTLTAVAGSQTFTFTGMLTNATTMGGSYSSTAGTAGDGTTPCGTAQNGLQWSAALVPPLNGGVQGSFHSIGGTAGLRNQDFALTGVLTQGPNIGASNATVTGTLTFVDPVSLVSAYPCFSAATVNGQISGNSVILKIIGFDGSDLGQIGGSVGSGLGTVTYDSTKSGYVLHSLVGPAYAVNSPSCPGSAGIANPADGGNICLSTSATACQQPITLSPPALIFPAQLLGAASTTQTITLANAASSATLNGLQLQWSVNSGSFGGPSDFNGLNNFTEQDNCATSLGSTFSLGPAQSCIITISFTPQESCPWLPFVSPGNPLSLLGAPPAACPFPVTALLTVVSPSSADSDTNFAVPITGSGISAITPLTPELDFGAEALSESSLPQLLSFTNHSPNPVQILGGTCTNPTFGSKTLPHPLQESSPTVGMLAGLQVVANGSGIPNGINAAPPTITYICDIDSKSSLPNFQITSDTCTGTLLASQATCSLEIGYVPQPATNLNSGLDYFLELNTLQCSPSDNVTSDCEIDSGRFPVELRANPPSPLRMAPGAGLNFGKQVVGGHTPSQTITLFNDPNDPNAGAVNLTGNVVKGDYTETDDCGFSLAPGGSCTLTIAFKPKIVGFDPGTITITTSNVTQNQTIYLRGTGQ